MITIMWQLHVCVCCKKNAIHAAVEPCVALEGEKKNLNNFVLKEYVWDFRQ